MHTPEPATAPTLTDGHVEKGEKRDSDPAILFIVALVIVRVIVLFLAVHDAATKPVGDADILRFHEIAHASGTPWRDMPVEYMPGEVLVIDVVAGGTTADTARNVAVVAFVCDVGAAAAIGWAFGRRAAAAYLVLGAPLLTFIYVRLDPIPVFATALALAWFAKRRDAKSGVAFALGILLKLWPAVVLPIAIVRRRWTVAMVAGTLVLIGGFAWIAWGSFEAPIQVASARHAEGWGDESLIGTAVWIATGATPRLVQGTPRVGAISGWMRAGLLVALAATLALVWTRATRWRGHPEGAPALAAVCALLVLSPNFSLQYASWLLVPAAIAAVERQGRPIAGAALATTILTGVLAVSYVALPSGASSSFTVFKVLLVARNACVVGAVAWFLAATNPWRRSVQDAPRETPVH